MYLRFVLLFGTENGITMKKKTTKSYQLSTVTQTKTYNFITSSSKFASPSADPR